ncbi:hypothetical protein E2C01_027461 [Portunus trituberculatus]|uniref:Uncharacterized protein n=1 Tax=Portunus trituberculatus TaxID=210409 RepID=A0A5B7EKW7_PORTR|nr:hypothetical protein [Portunus trituberculatus]
MWRGVARVAR